MSAYESSEQLFQWCNIPPEALPDHPQAKVKLKILPTAAAIYDDLANTMVDELRRNNELKNPTRWILPCGPRGQYPVFIEKVNREQISLKHLHVFHMDDHLDWQGRHLPLDHPYSYQGWMTRNFYDPVHPALSVPLEQRHFPNISRLDEIAEEMKKVGRCRFCFWRDRVPRPHCIQRAASFTLVPNRQRRISPLHDARPPSERGYPDCAQPSRSGRLFRCNSPDGDHCWNAGTSVRASDSALQRDGGLETDGYSHTAFRECQP